MENAAGTNPFETPKASLEKQPLNAASAPPLWNPDVAGAWSLLFTPIFGSIIVRKNWIALGEESKARTATIWIIASVLAAIAGALVGFAAFIYIIVWYFAWQKPQATYIKERWAGDYPRKGWLVPVLIALGVWAVLLLAIFLIVLMAGRAA